MPSLECSRLYAFGESDLRALQAQDVGAETHLVRYFTPLLQITLRRRMYSPDQIDDIVQETFIRVLKKFRSGEAIQPERLGAYVNGVCKNVSRESYRALNRHVPLDGLAIDPADTAAGPDEMLSRQESKKKVHQTLAQLTLRDRDLLRHIFLEQRDKDEVCRELGVTRDYLRVLVCRAKGQFQKLYESEEPQPVKVSFNVLEINASAYSHLKEIMSSIRAARRAGR